jgi:DNA gyrase/topoisomerase IV subunit A
MGSLIEIKLNGKSANLQVPALQLKHSLMYSLFSSKSFQENIEDEVLRIHDDLDILNGVISTDIAELARICRIAKNEKEMTEILATELNLNKSQAEYIANLELDDLINLDFKKIKYHLELCIIFLQKR